MRRYYLIRRNLSTWNGWWEKVGPAPADSTFGITDAFLADPSPNKINLGVVCAASILWEKLDFQIFQLLGWLLNFVVEMCEMKIGSLSWRSREARCPSMRARCSCQDLWQWIHVISFFLFFLFRFVLTTLARDSCQAFITMIQPKERIKWSGPGHNLRPISLI